mmetsp:Transcript_16433/g.28212  ORF Transcript_16433/g.28212 Transcript_16433/m.28212 type:complete len:227 (+) Transcript_16433:657-1337(+)
MRCRRWRCTVAVGFNAFTIAQVAVQSFYFDFFATRHWTHSFQRKQAALAAVHVDAFCPATSVAASAAARRTETTFGHINHGACFARQTLILVTATWTQINQRDRTVRRVSQCGARFVCAALRARAAAAARHHTAAARRVVMTLVFAFVAVFVSFAVRVSTVTRARQVRHQRVTSTHFCSQLAAQRLHLLRYVVGNGSSMRRTLFAASRLAHNESMVLFQLLLLFFQ